MNPRIRSIKPSFFRNAKLYDAEIASGLPIRVCFAGLWTVADRDGRFPWNPRELKVLIAPHDAIDFSKVLDVLAKIGKIVPYLHEGEMYGVIPTWYEHQYTNHREAKSILPPPTVEGVESAQSQLSLPMLPFLPDARACTGEHGQTLDGTGRASVDTGHALGGREGKGREGIKSLAEQSSSPPTFELPLVTGKLHGIRAEEIAKWEKTFPGVDVRYQLRKMLLWLDNNPRRRKTKRGVNKFITNWLGEEYEKLSAQKPQGAQRERPTASQRMAAGKE